MRLRASNPNDNDLLFDVWYRAVKTTHDFISEQDLRYFSELVREHYLPEHQFTVVIDDDERPFGFLGMTGSNVDALFIDPNRHGHGAGRALLEHAMQMCPDGLTVDVNEGNGQAVRFYEYMGFRTVKRSPLDGSGKPYPILHMRRP